MNVIELKVLSSSGVAVAPPGKLEIAYGQTLRITTSFNYRGPAVDITLYGSIGQHEAGFDEIVSAEATKKLSESRTAFVSVTATVDIPITADISPGADYDIYCKILEYPEAGQPQVNNAITVIGVLPLPTEEEEVEKKKFPWWILGAAGGAAVLVIAATSKKGK